MIIDFDEISVNENKESRQLMSDDNTHCHAFVHMLVT